MGFLSVSASINDYFMDSALGKVCKAKKQEKINRSGKEN
jgi:hypothetical protein